MTKSFSIAGTAPWIAAILMVIVPVVVAFDYGGVLHWTQLVIGYAVITSSLFAFGGLWANSRRDSIRINHRDQIVMLLASAWLGLTWIQTLSVSPALAQTLSPASFDAYTNWLRPLISVSASPSDGFATSVPLSIASDLTRHAALFGCIILLLTWAATWTFDSPNRVGWLLVGSSIGISCQAVYAIWCIIMPEHGIASPTEGRALLAFGSFINRNHAGLYLCLGLGCCLGAIAWRFSQMNRVRLGEATLQWGHLERLFSDPISILVLCSACFCLVGILASGSLVGICGLIGGCITSVRWFRLRRPMIVFGVSLICIVGLTSWFLVTSVQQGSVMNHIPSSDLLGHENVTSDARWSHWQDGMRTAWQYFPFGSGAGTYAYAYLPFQNASPAAWFHHADNLWLELFVEQGLLGISIPVILFGCLFCITGYLYESLDAVDHGIRAAALFCTGAVLSTQTLDFGLILPANLMIVVMIVAAAFARGRIARYATTVDRNPLPESPSGLLVATGAATGIACCLFACLALPKIHLHASEQAVWWESKSVLANDFHDADRLDFAIEMVQSALSTHRSATLLVAASQLVHLRARLTEVEEQNLDDTQEVIEAYRKTGNRTRRLQNNVASDPENDGDSLDLYALARRYAIESMYRLPLGIESRAQYIYLDFVASVESDSPLAISQLSRLQSRNPKQLLRLALLAEDSEATQLASDLHRQLNLLAPVYTGHAVRFALRNPSISLVDQIPRTRSCQIQAAKHLMRHDDDRNQLAKRADEFLARSVSYFRCEQSETKNEQSACEFLAANVCFEVNQVKAGLDHLQKSVELTPTDPAKRVILIRTLHRSGDTEGALAEARRSHALIAGDKRFQQLIQKLAAEKQNAVQVNGEQ